MSYDIRMRDPVSGEGLQDNFLSKDIIVDFLTAQLLLWKLGKGRLPNSFQIQITEVP